MCLLSQFVLGVAVGVNRAVQLLEGHQSHDELIIGMQQATKPLFVLYVMNLGIYLVVRPPHG